VRGIDERTVEPRLEARSISRDETFAADLDDDPRLEAELLALIGRAASDLRADGLCARTITVRIRDADFRTRQASRTLHTGVSVDRAVAEVAKPLLRRLRAARKIPARLLGVSLSGLSAHPGADQLAFFEMQTQPLESDRDRALARTVDALREKFGSDSIGPAATHGRTGRHGRD
jgi:DNA polymerase-4